MTTILMLFVICAEKFRPRTLQWRVALVPIASIGPSSRFWHRRLGNVIEVFPIRHFPAGLLNGLWINALNGIHLFGSGSYVVFDGLLKLGVTEFFGDFKLCLGLFYDLD